MRVDSLPAGLAFKQLFSAVADSGISYTGSLNPVVSNNGRTVTFDLGDVTIPTHQMISKGSPLSMKPLFSMFRRPTPGQHYRTQKASPDWSTPHTLCPQFKLLPSR